MIFERILKTLLFVFIVSTVSAQDFSNKGTEFWVGYGYHQSMRSGLSTENSQNMVLYFTADVAAVVKVEIPAVGWSKTYNVAANSVTESDVMPKAGSQDARLLDEGLYNTGIHITSNNPVVAYAHIYDETVSGASLLFPVNTLGQDYYSLNFTQKSNSSNSNSWAFVIATEDNTAVEITPSANTKNLVAGVPTTVMLNKGQIYNIMGTTNGNLGVDLTGTRIRSVSAGTAACKKIAVFSGSGRMSIYCDNTVTSSDNLIQQVFPQSAWGRKFLTVPTSKLPNNYFRIAVSDPTTVVTIDGVKATNLINNFYYEIFTNTPKSIIADKPVMVAQYITSTDGAYGPTCGNSFSLNGDPEMIYLSPIEQTIDKITLNSTSHYQITSHFINVILKSSAINSFTIDGAPAASSFVTHPQDPAYSYAVLNVAKGFHTLKADSGFNAIAYGYGSQESYGYNAGTNIKDLYQFLTLKNQYTTVNFPTTCQNTKFTIFITLPLKPSSIVWDFGGNTHISPNQNITDNNPGYDSSYVLDGRTLYRYSLSSLYSFDAIGSYPVKITVNNQSSDGCNGLEELTYNFTVLPAPAANFTYKFSGCATDTIQFNDASNGNGRPLQKWIWNFSDGKTDSVQNPHKAFATSGTYTIKETTVNDLGCSADTTMPLTIAPQPVANFNFTKPVCEGIATSFTDLSKIAVGKIIKWHWDFGNNDTITNFTNAPVARTFKSGTNNFASLQVENESGCKSEVFKQAITVFASPVVSFDMGSACLPLANAKFTNLSTINDGTDNTLSYSWDFGDGGTATIKNPQHTYTSAGPFSVKLKVTAVDGCVKDSTKTFSTIYPQPVAAFSNNPQTICLADSVHFVDASSAANSSVTEWHWNFGNGSKDSVQNPVTKYADSGLYQVSLYVKSAAGCNSDTAIKNIYINKPPTAAFSIPAIACSMQPFTITDQSKSNSGVINSWSWNFGDGTSQNLSTGNPFTRMINSPGTYTISLVAASNYGCKSDTAKHTIIVQPLPFANFTTPVVCINDPFAAFTDSSYMPAGSTGTPFSYSWNFGDNNATPANANTSTLKNPQHKFIAAGNYNVTLTVTPASGCTATLTKPFTVNGIPQADFSMATIAVICSNSVVTIKNSSTINIGSITKLQIVWDQNNASAIETDSTPFVGKIYSHTFPAAASVQTYQVKMIVFSGTSCFSEKVWPVTVNPSPKVLFQPITGICLNDPARAITGATETTGIPGTFAFSGPGISSSGIFNPALAGSGNATIKYVFTSTAGCADSAFQTINVVPNPVIKFTTPVYVLDGGSTILSPAVTGNISKYLWTPSTYLNSNIVKNPVSTPKDSITYTLTAATALGCEGSGMVKIVLLKTLGIPNVFSPNGDGINDFWNIASLASYPNCKVQVFNRYGSIVYTSNGYSMPWNGTFNGTVLPVGVYYYIINLNDGKLPYTGNVTILK